jgi:hypothetical protein
MKKNFSIKDEKHAPEQKLNIIKGEIKKYFARERRKPLPKGFDAWDFDCRVGVDSETAVIVEEKDLKQRIDKLVELGKKDFFVEVLSRAIRKNKSH